MRNGSLTPMALAVLETLHERPRHPYDIHQIMQEREVWRMVKLTTGSLYHTIERLADDGLIAVVETSRAGRRPERTTYRVTEAGVDAFAARLRTLIAEPATEYPLYPLAVGLLHELERDDALFQLRRRAIALEAQLAADRVLETRVGELGVHPLYFSDVELRRRLRETELAFTRDLVNRIETGQYTWPHTVGTPRRLSLVDEGNQENVG